MGEYEPDDSRKVTLNPGDTPGEPPRTGPREGEARARAEDKDKKPVATNEAVPVDRDGKRLPQQQQKAQQSQSQDGQSQSQGNSEKKPGRTRDMNSEQPEGSPLAGNQPQGASGTPGDPSPHYDQYEVNQPSNIGHNDSAAPRQQAGGTIADAAPEQAGDLSAPADQQQPGDTDRQRAQAEQQSDGKAQTGYGNSRDEDGESEQEAAPEKGGSDKTARKDDGDAQDKGEPGLTDTPDGVARADGNRALYEGPKS